MTPTRTSGADHLSQAQGEQDRAFVSERSAADFGAIPSFSTNLMPNGIGPTISFGGSNLAATSSSAAAAYRQAASRLIHEAGKAGRIGGYARREQDWQFQSNAAAGELNQITSSYGPRRSGSTWPSVG